MAPSLQRRKLGVELALVALGLSVAGCTKPAPGPHGAPIATCTSPDQVDCWPADAPVADQSEPCAAPSVCASGVGGGGTYARSCALDSNGASFCRNVCATGDIGVTYPPGTIADGHLCEYDQDCAAGLDCGNDVTGGAASCRCVSRCGPLVATLGTACNLAATPVGSCVVRYEFDDDAAQIDNPNNPVPEWWEEVSCVLADGSCEADTEGAFSRHGVVHDAADPTHVGFISTVSADPTRRGHAFGGTVCGSVFRWTSVDANAPYRTVGTWTFGTALTYEVAFTDYDPVSGAAVRQCVGHGRRLTLSSGQCETGIWENAQPLDNVCSCWDQGDASQAHCDLDDVCSADDQEDHIGCALGVVPDAPLCGERCPFFAFTSGTLPAAQSGVAYQAAIPATTGGAPVRYALEPAPGEAHVPLWLRYDAGVGLLLGTPPATGTAKVTITASDVCKGIPRQIEQTFDIVIGCGPVSLGGGALRGATEGAEYDTALVPVASAPFTFTLTGGALPAGLSLSGAGRVTGTPTVTGDFTFEVQVTDSCAQSASATFTLHVAPGVTGCVPAFADVSGTYNERCKCSQRFSECTSSACEICADMDASSTLVVTKTSATHYAFTSDGGFAGGGELCGTQLTWTADEGGSFIYSESGVWVFSDARHFTQPHSSYTAQHGGVTGECTATGAQGASPPEPAAIGACP